MRKKITKLLESALPPLYTKDGDIINRRDIANKIYDSISNVEKLDIAPFETWVPLACSPCYFNGGYRNGCTYEYFHDATVSEHKVPAKCPLGHRN